VGPTLTRLSPLVATTSCSTSPVSASSTRHGWLSKVSTLHQPAGGMEANSSASAAAGAWTAQERCRSE
jgi:hypothetical protein